MTISCSPGAVMPVNNLWGQQKQKQNKKKLQPGGTLVSINQKGLLHLCGSLTLIIMRYSDYTIYNNYMKS